MPPSPLRRPLVALLALVALPVALVAQGTGKKPITQDVYDIWNTIEDPVLSPDGRWAGYTISPVVGDGEAIVRATSGATTWSVPRGWTGRPITSVETDNAFNLPPIMFSADSRWAAMITYAPKAEHDRARRARGRARRSPPNSLALISLTDGKVTTFEHVRAARLADYSAKYLFYHLAPPDSAARDSLRDSSATRAPARDSSAGNRERRLGTVLVVRDLASGSETRISDVSSFAVDDSARWLAYSVTARDSTTDGVYLRELASGDVHPLLTGAGSYAQLTFDRAGRQFAFVSDRDEHAREKPRFGAWLVSLQSSSPTAKAIITPGSIDGMSVSERGRFEFTRDGSTLLLGVAPERPDTIPADSLADKAVYDLWHWKDPRLQPQQKLEAARDFNRSFTTVYHIATGKAIRLADDSLPNVNVSDDGRVALGLTGVPYAVQSMWGDDGDDVWLIDAVSGKRTKLATKVHFRAQLSPGGRYVTWFEDDRWWSYAIGTGKKTDLTGALTGVRFDQETWDRPSPKAPWGTGGWTTDDTSLLLYDRYDIWEVDPTGARAPRMVTDSLGVREHMVFRAIDLDEDDPYVDASQPLLLEAFNIDTKAAGFYRERLGATRVPERIVMADKAFGTPRKARDAETLLLTESTVAEFPNLWTGTSLDRLTRITDANPQQSEYPWPTVELVSWLSDDGVPLKGMLYKPENYDPSKKYPMVVYFYEQLSDNLHRYHAPSGRNVVNPTVYTSKGYLVFFPDIVYTDGWPGPSAIKCIIPGVKSIIARGIVDPAAIGVAGQSWGGYQIAYMITQTSLFAAAVPNAPVANMTSAYGGIRWGSGLARSFQYEKTQSRIGGSLWEYPIRYIENSPLFHLDRVTTPVFFMQNDADDAVPWYQGIELFVGLRRLEKEVYFVVYNGDRHNPRKRANQKDVDEKMLQFFANKLQGAPAPDWMVHGIPYLDKGRSEMIEASQTRAEQGAQARESPARPN